MASVPSCATRLLFASKPQKPPSLLPKLSSKFLGIQNKGSWVRPCRIGPSNGSRVKCWFKFGKNGVDAEGAGIYGSQSRDDFDRDDVEQVLSLSLSQILCFGSGFTFVVCFFVDCILGLEKAF